MIDVHCHIDLYPNPIEVANESERLDIYTIAVTNLPSHFEKGHLHLRSYKKVRLALGLHPLYAKRHKDEIALFDKWLDHTSYIGEVGLDFSKEGIATKEQQLKSFKHVLSKIEQQKKIISLHSRGAEREVLELLNHYNSNTAIFHWYTGPIDLIDTIINAGYLFSINPAMIYSKRGQEIIQKIPLSHLLTESDGPFIQIKQRPIVPKDIKVVVAYLAKFHNISEVELENTIKNNFKKIINSLIG